MTDSIAITGCGGFIGNELANYFLSKGRNVIGLNRAVMKIDDEKFIYVRYDLEKEFNFSLLKNASVIIHCAFLQWSDANQNADEINIKATSALADFCEREGKKFIFLSSFSAHDKATSHYGKHKFELENKLKEKHLVIKPGLVIGKRGMFSNLSKIVSEKKFIPIIGNGKQPFQWIHINELCKAIENGIEKKFSGVFPIASEKSISFIELNELIAHHNKKSPFFIHVHPLFAEILLKVLPAFAKALRRTQGKKLPFTKENLDGLLQLREFDTKESLKQLEISIAPIY